MLMKLAGGRLGTLVVVRARCRAAFEEELRR